MDKVLAILCFIAAIVVSTAAFPEGVVAALFGVVWTCIALALLKAIRVTEQFEEFYFLRRIFLMGLLLRVLLAIITFVFKLQEFFGGDSLTYDYGGYLLMQSWFGYQITDNSFLQRVTNFGGSGWGMAYIVAAIYSITGRNPLAVQMFNSVLGAATAPLIYICAMQLFRNQRVARLSAYFVALFPSLITWTSQGLKDGIIVFLLVLAINAVLRLQEKFSYASLVWLLFSMIGIFSLRFYIFFAFIVAVAGSFAVTAGKSIQSLVRRVVVVVIIGLALTYVGVLRNAQEQVETFSNLERLQQSRLDQARAAESGYGRDFDVSTPLGALQALPIGFAYFMFAPFPWQVNNFRQAVTLPEMLAWWAAVPLLVSGLWYTLRNQLRRSVGILLFILLLTLSYSIFQGNVGTAYRQRAQMQVFYFIFIAVGIVLIEEKRQNQKALRVLHQRQLMARRQTQKI